MPRLTTLLLVLLISLPSRAEPAPPRSSASEAPESASLDYRPLLLLSDTATVAALIAAIAVNKGDSPELALAGLGV